MNLGDMRWHLEQRFDDIPDTANSNRLLNQAARELSEKFQCIKAAGTIATVIGTMEYDLPSDLIPKSLRRVIWDKYRLSSASIDDRDYWEQVATSGTPERYYVWGSKIGLLPKPSAVKNLLLWYAKYPVAMIVDTDISELPEVLHMPCVLTAVYRALSADEDDRRMEVFSELRSMLQEAEESLKGEQAESFLVYGGASREILMGRLRYPWE
ncbi:MAG: hypothetical protein ACOY4I_04735 [Bacillota bacterium]